MPDVPVRAVQLYTLRSLTGSFEAALQAVVQAGGEAVETVGRHGLDASTMLAAADRCGVRIVSMHLPLTELREDPEGSAAFAQAVGADTVVVPYLPQDQRPAEAEGWHRLGASLETLGAHFAKRGVRLAYHNHDFELARFGDRLAIDLLLSGATPELLAFEPDLAWIARAGHDPLELLARHSGRCPIVHVKDLAQIGTAEDEDGWSTVGRGVLDWDELLPAARSAGAGVFVLEHDRPADPLTVVRDGLSFLEHHQALA